MSKVSRRTCGCPGGFRMGGETADASAVSPCQAEALPSYWYGFARLCVPIFYRYTSCSHVSLSVLLTQ